MLNRIKFALVGVLALGAVGIAIAQHPDRPAPDPKAVAAHKELHQQIQTWAKSNVLPQLRTWKTQLDGAMSAADLQTLNGLRTRAAALRTQERQDGRVMWQAHKNKDEQAITADREKMKQLRTEHKAIMEQLKPLAEKYMSTLKTIGADAKTKIPAWHESVQSIVKTWKAQHQADLPNKDGDAHEMGGGHHGGEGMGFGMMGGHNPHKMIARFMLWNGEDFTQQDQGSLPQGAAPQGAPAIK